MTSCITIRAASGGDIPALSALESRYYVGNLGPAERANGYISVLHPTQWWVGAVAEGGIHVAVTDADEVVGFMGVLAPPDPAEPGLPAPLKSMLDLTKTLEMNGTKIADQRFAVHGPSCIAEEVRGQGVYSALHAVTREAYRDRYDVAVLFVAADNPRSLHTTMTRLDARPLAEFEADGKRFHFLAFEF